LKIKEKTIDPNEKIRLENLEKMKKMFEQNRPQKPKNNFGPKR
jgi:hypothetical protein